LLQVYKMKERQADKTCSLCVLLDIAFKNTL
jgi:hypothetical protein